MSILRIFDYFFLSPRMEFRRFAPYCTETEKNLTTMIKKMLQKKGTIIGMILFTGIMLVSLPSCKHQEDCGAYQGSHKSSRSHKKHHRHAMVVRFDNTQIG
jgi:hypothetical protein